MKGTEHEHGHRAHAVAVGHAPRRRRVAHWIGRWHWNWTRRWDWSGLHRTANYLFQSRLVRRLLLGTVICGVVATVAVLGLWWRLSSGPIELNVATPWLKAAIEENFGGNHTVIVG